MARSDWETSPFTETPFNKRIEGIAIPIRSRSFHRQGDEKAIKAAGRGNSATKIAVIRQGADEPAASTVACARPRRALSGRAARSMGGVLHQPLCRAWRPDRYLAARLRR